MKKSKIIIKNFYIYVSGFEATPAVRFYMDSARCKAFVESVDRGSFRAAADELGYTPSAVSQLVAALEKDLGLSLLIRSKKGVKMTPDGKKIYPIARAIITREAEMYHLANELKGVTVGSVTIAAYPSVAITWLPEIVRRFQADYPEIQIKIMEGIRAEIDEHLDGYVADFAFMAYDDHMPYKWIPLAEEAVIAAVPENHPLAGSTSYPVKAVENDAFVMTSWGKDLEVLNIFHKNHVHPEIKYTTYDTPAALAMVRMGLGVSFVNELSATNWNDHLVKLPLDPPEQVTFGIAYKSEDHMSRAAKKFISYAVKYLTKAES